MNCVRGSIPDYVRGTYLFNGPANFQLDKQGSQYRNWLDGDGMVASLKIDHGSLTFRSRYVQGRKFVRETELNRRVYRTFGTAFVGDRLKRGIGTESPYNVSVFRYRGRMLAFGEQSLPMELDSETLETVTPGNAYDFNGALNEASPFSAHPKIDSRTGELLNFGVFYSPKKPVLVYYRFDQNGSLACRTNVPIDMPCSLHDFAASEHYVVFYLSPYILDSSKLIERGSSTMDSLSWEPERGSQILILDRESGQVVARISMEGRYCLHTISAFESPSMLIVDLIEFDRPMYDQYQLEDLFFDAPFGQPVRYKIDLTCFTIVERNSMPYDKAPDFPAIDSRLESREYNQLWMLGIANTGSRGRKFFDQLVHLKWSEPDRPDIWSCPRGQFLGSEPMFIPDPNSDGDGVVLCHLLDAVHYKSQFAFFKSDCIAAGPIALVAIPRPVHLGFHAIFLPAN